MNKKIFALIVIALATVLIGGFFIWQKSTVEKITLAVSGYGYEVGDIVEIDPVKIPQVGDIVFYNARLNRSFCFAFGSGSYLAKITGVPGDKVKFSQSLFSVNEKDFPIKNNDSRPFIFGNKKYENIPPDELEIVPGELMADKWIGNECPGEIDETGSSIGYSRFTIEVSAVTGVILKKVGHDSEFASEVKNTVY